MNPPSTLLHRDSRRRRVTRLAAQAAVLSAAALATAAPAALADTTVHPAADSYIDASVPATRFATSSLLSVDGSPARRALLRFNAPAGTASSAKLRLWSTGSAAESAAIRTAKCGWTDALTWNRRPALGTVIATKARVAAGWNEFTLPASALPSAGGPVCLSVTKSAATEVKFHSKDAAHPAELVIGQSGPANTGPAPTDPTPTPTPDPVPTPTPPAQPSGNGVYGNPWGGDYLANLEVGRNGRQVDYRFRAESTGTISSVRIYFIFGAPGYYAGNGGDVRVTLESDTAGSPSGTVLSSGLVTDPLAQNFRTIPLSAAQVVAGQIYHLRFVNVDPNPSSNWVSVDDLGNSARTTPVQPGVSDSDLAVLYRDGASSSWTHNTGHTPIFTLFHSDGSAHGPGAPYINARSSSGLHSISGTNRIAEQFTVSGSARTVRSAAFRVRKSGSPGALTMRLATANGTTIDTATVPASSIPSSASWVKASFNAAHSLTPGQSYRLELSAPAGDAYQAWPLTEGSGFASPTMFTDGAAQVSSNGGSSWSTPSGADDWQFYLGA